MPKRIDDNQNEIVKELRRVGAEVQSLADLGRGCADTLVAFRGVWYVAEIKDGSKSPSRQKLTDAEIDWHKKFTPHAPVHIWRSLDDALRTIGAVKLKQEIGVEDGP